ncbi:activated protein kinase catalytic subunit alpha-1 [Seminavis robusta]|uniref:guanylate cyclase n=1 Tax=Seminavis robusta TaxID=568900 RepID=A0A9N8DH52_9STRA|nr:activated protein kinase catalytic subunit alpha-1 [Seminavis robusta]|eukprot:Sro150_g068770.1 activated protein kinase catalytic subunit alpha-1 (1290) ;mRNA; f:35135-40089
MMNLLTSYICQVSLLGLLASMGMIVGTNGAVLDVYSAMSSQMDCTSPRRDFNEREQKTHYKVGVHAIRGVDAAYEEYNKTFGEYLTATAGNRFDPPITFEMVPVTFQELFDKVATEDIDFFYANPGIFSCVGTEVGAQPIATIVSRLEVRGHEYELDVFGGVIFTRADNDDINTIQDLQDKIIGAGAMSQVMAGQVQFYEMLKAGMSYIMDPKQVVFAYDQTKLVHGVLDREFDVGFVRTDTIERTKDANGNTLDPDLFKVIEPKIFVLDDGNLFPFLHSTDIYPEWPVAALTHVNKDVSEEVQEALLAVGKHAKVGKAMEECELGHPNSTAFCEMQEFPDYFDPQARCDTTRELARLAWEGSKVGKWAGFRTSRSYAEPRTMQEAAHLMIQDERGNWKCGRSEKLYDSIVCPAGHYLKSQRDFDRACEQNGLICKEGYDCYCKPCVKAFEVSVYPVGVNASDGNKIAGCGKMSVCGHVQQKKTITFRAFDNKEREGATLTVKMHDEDDTRNLDVTRINDTFAYEFGWSDDKVGVGIMEIFVDGKQIPESPIRVQVTPRECNEDYSGQGKVPDEYGNCICGSGTLELGDKCVSSAIFFVIIAAVVLLLVLEAGYCFIGYKKRQSDQLWLVNVEELHFDDPVEVIGQGAFGVVLKAEYRGTTVAIKRVLSQGEKRKADKSGSRDGSKDGSMVPGNTLGKNGSASSDTGSLDLEAQTYADQGGSGGSGITNENSEDSGLNSAEMMTQSTSDPMSVDLDFLGNGFSFGKKRNGLAKWIPFFDRDEHARLKSSILGTASGNTSKSTAMGTFCPCFDSQARQKAEFIQEMRLLSRLRHPCITTVMGAVIGHGHDPMLVMEFCEYGSLHDLLRNETMYAGGEICLQILRDVSSGIRYLHASKPPILHGDLKAKNILIDSRFRAKVGDFGLSTKQKSGISGTPYYMAPEYLRGKTDYNTSCDIYALGIILYEIYARKTPYEGENPRQVLRKVCDPRVNKRPLIPDTCPPKILEIMKKCWSQDPFFRPQAKDLDMLFMDMTMQDAEPLSVGATHGRIDRPTGDMLYQVFPSHIADALKAGEKVEPETHDNVTIVFSDIVHFTDISASLSPLKVSNLLDRLYLSFDSLARQHKVFKVETIGDAYMGVTNLGGAMESDHVKAIAEFAMDAVEAAGLILIDEDDPKRGYVRIRVGLHTGPVVSNVIGSLNPRYGLFGDTVNVASRMESNSISRRIQCSEKSAKLLALQAPHIPLIKRGKIGVKGKGDMTTYWIGDKPKVSKEQAKEGPRVDFLAETDLME